MNNSGVISIKLYGAEGMVKGIEYGKCKYSG